MSVNVCACVMCVFCVSVRVRTCVLAVDTWSRSNMTYCITCPSVSLCFTLMGEQGTVSVNAHMRHDLKLIKFALYERADFECLKQTTFTRKNRKG
jgi:hypothetical protein